MLTLGYSEDGDQPLTETVKNEIETYCDRWQLGWNLALSINWWMNRSSASFYFASFCKWIKVIEENAIVIRFLFFFEILIACWLLSRPNWRVVSKLTTDVGLVTYCTEASNQKSKYAYRKVLFYKKKHWLYLSNLFVTMIQMKLVAVCIVVVLLVGCMLDSAQAQQPGGGGGGGRPIGGHGEGGGQGGRLRSRGHFRFRRAAGARRNVP